MNMKSVLFGMTAAASLPLLAVIATPASAAMPAPVNTGIASLVEKARSDCKWVDNKWTYQKGDKRLVCRPNRPSGRGWGWHREGSREGWYHGTRKAWHNLVW